MGLVLLLATSFSTLLEELVRASGVPRGKLEGEIREVHQRYGTTEYSNLVNEIPSLIQLASPEHPHVVFSRAIEAFRATRRNSIRLYSDVFETLSAIRTRGVRVVAYTESPAYWTEWRIRKTRLDGLIDVLYSSEDHDFPEGTTVASIRTQPLDTYGLTNTIHKTLPRGLRKPNTEVLRKILSVENASSEDAVYIGDSLMKDIAMAQDAGVLDIHAAYGVAHERSEYELLRRVTHWTDAEVEREKSIHRNVIATFSLSTSFGEVGRFFEL